MPSLSNANSSLFSGILGLIVGALVIFFGIENLTEKMMTANENLGVLKANMNDAQEETDIASDSVGSIIARLENMEKHADKIEDKLKIN